MKGTPAPDRIEKYIELRAPIAAVWRALTDYREFGQWFRVSIEGPFSPGKISRGQITYPGYEQLKWEVTIKQMEPERHFSFTWHPFATDSAKDYSKESPTLVEFHLQETAVGTRLSVSESGFDGIPGERRGEAYEANSKGWTEQLKNIERFVSPAANPGRWFEIYVQNMERAKAFYEDVFQCSLQKLEHAELDMWAFPMRMDKEGISGALVKMPGVSSGGNSTLIYFGCEDCATQAARVTEFGGKVLRPKVSIGQYGFIALAYDTEGNVFGLHSMK